MKHASTRMDAKAFSVPLTVYIPGLAADKALTKADRRCSAECAA